MRALLKSTAAVAALSMMATAASAAGTDWQLNVYGNTVHSFTNPSADRQHRPYAIRYSAAADRESWHAMLSLFDRALS